MPLGARSHCRDGSMVGTAEASFGQELRPARYRAGRDDAPKAEEKIMTKLSMKTEGDTHIVASRRFKAPPEAVYRAHTEPKLIQRWMLGPDGWSMPVCICDARPGGKFRYEWAKENRGGFHVAGEFIELKPHSRVVH